MFRSTSGIGFALLSAALVSSTVFAQSGTGTRVTGSYGFTSGLVSEQATFACTGEPTCTGTFQETLKFGSVCSNDLVVNGSLTITGMNLAQPGPIQGNYTYTFFEIINVVPNANGSCSYPQASSLSTYTAAYKGTWDGRTGTFTITDVDASGNTVPLNGTFRAVRSSIPPPPPVFPMTVTGGVANNVGNVQAAIQFRPEDVNKPGSVYVFALAPANLVKNAVVSLADWHAGPMATGLAKDTPIPCVLAQLSSTGQLTAVSASNLQAYLSGTLSSQGASVNVLNNVNTVPLVGSVFYVGYGANSTAMINNGVNRSAITVPGTQTCQPQAPETGWWWNKSEPGRGFSIETQGNHLFMAGYLYDISGRSTWIASSGLTSLDGSLYNSTFQTFAGGQTLTGTYKPPGSPVTAGAITMSFSDARNGTLTWPGGTIAIQRFDIAPPSSAAPPAFAPENGWWWNPSEAGRGYFMEFSNSTAFIAGYMYDTSGNPLWYLASGNMATTQTFQGSWTQWANGQTLTGAFKPASQINPNVGALGLQFQTSSSATLTLPGGRQIPITRFGF